ncbi:MAG: exosortase C-terminal domain/associated protein EpsI, partial [Gemmatimonadota bacterium]
MRNWQRWIPGGLLAGGFLLNSTLISRRTGPVELTAPIAGVAVEALGAKGVDLPISDDERRVAGMSSYVLREYEPQGVLPFSVYIGYYDEQRQGKSIHSPKNCLPGAGWEPVDSRPMTIATAAGPVVVNRYRLVRSDSTAMVYYWYQGRGRVAHDEFRVKYELLRDAALYGRTEEALVRIVVRIGKSDPAAADELGRQVGAQLVDQVRD